MEAYSSLVSTLFSQGELTWRKEQVSISFQSLLQLTRVQMLQEVRWALHISDEAHRRELQRVHADPMLVQIRAATTKEHFFPGGVRDTSGAADPDASAV